VTIRNAKLITPENVSLQPWLRPYC